MKFKTIPMVLVLTFLLSAVSGSANQKTNEPATRAVELLKQAREAIGGDEKLHEVQSLSARATFRRTMTGDDFVMSGEVTLDFLLPDKFMKSETLNGPEGTGPTMVQTLNGDREWSDVKSNGPGVFMTYGQGPEADKNAEADRVKDIRQEFARYLLVFLLRSPPSSQPVEFIYAGEAEAEDGRADVLDIKSAEGFAARLFLDQQTHLPLMISFSTKISVIAFRQFQGPAQEPKGGLVTRAQVPASNDQLKGNPPPGVRLAQPELRQVQIELRFSDYRAVEGLLLPHRIHQRTGEDLTEEWQMKKYQLNPLLKPEKFQKKDERRAN